MDWLVAGLIIIVLCIIAVILWIANIYQLCFSNKDRSFNIIVMKIVGIFIPPLGMFLGFLGFFGI